MIFLKRKGNTYPQDYHQEIDIHAELCMTQLSDLSSVEKDELIGLWLEDDFNQDEKIDILVTWVRSFIPEYLAEDVFSELCCSQALSEMMFGSCIFSKHNVGYLLDESLNGGLSASFESIEEAMNSLVSALRNGKHVHQIDEDMKEAHLDFITSVDECESGEARRTVDSVNVVTGARMGF